MDNKTILVRVASHRARHKLFSILSSPPQAFYSWEAIATGGFFLIPVVFLESALKITGITKASNRFEYFECWNVSNYNCG